MLFHSLQLLGEGIEIICVEPIEVVDVALLVDKFVGGETLHTEEVLDSFLLFGGEVVVGDIGACEVIRLDDVLPTLVLGVVGKV